MDVFTFLALDFGLRAVTVLTPPGSTGLQSALTCLWALICPAYGVRRALLAVGFPENHKGDSELEESIRNAWGRIKARVVGGERRSELEMALRSGALCMLVPSTVRIRSSQGAKPGPSVDEKAATEVSSAPKTTGREALPLETINPLMTSVHGQYPSDITPLCSPPVPPAREDEESGKGPAPPAEYSLVKVPSSFKVNPIMTEDDPGPLIGMIWRWIRMNESSSAETQKPKDLEESQSAVRRPKKAVPLRLSSNERIVKAICTIFQILYGSYELYRMGGDHLKKYGYAAYEFTIIPYLGDPNDTSSSNNQRSTTEDHGKSGFGQTEVMPLGVNEGADETQTLAYPEYWWDPSDRKKLEDNVIGAIGCVYGDFAKDIDGSEGKHHHFFSISTWKKRFLANVSSPYHSLFIDQSLTFTT
ncbi:hypothetical protein DFP73DRAFT_596146 [Morchella snyderi]|nr:hypothetical protein DFP73DRAFT_596146 [Morchella snyderi]